MRNSPPATSSAIPPGHKLGTDPGHKLGHQVTLSLCLLLTL
jgi:hypothetical protein